MKQIQYIIIAFLLIGCTINIQAQNTVWGEYEVKLLEEQKKLQVTFSYLNDIFYVVPGDEEGDIVLGNDKYKAIYNSKGDKGFLVEVLAGEEYMYHKEIEKQKAGFPYTDGREGLNTVMKNFTELSYTTYHPPKDFKPGWTDDKKTHANYLALLGKGNAYYGSVDLEGNMDGIGTYILDNRETYTGHWDKNVSKGEFIVRTTTNYDYKGEFVNGKKVGTWIRRKKGGYPIDGFLDEVEFVDGKIVHKKDISKKQDKSLMTKMDKEEFYKSHRTEVKIDGEWKTDYKLRDSLIYFEIYDGSNTRTITKYMKMDAKKTAMAEQEYRSMCLLKVEEDDEKRVEYYSYSFKDDFGISSPTITFYKQRKDVPDSFLKEYNILFYFPHEKGEYRYYFLMDEKEKESIKQAKATNDKMKEVQEKIKETLEKLDEMEDK